ncbi:MAG: hypothetical protein HYX79_10755 [Chloroflexi bacterium]|nr:hypothetical protein [Chloroflexota bacterium]
MCIELRQWIKRGAAGLTMEMSDTVVGAVIVIIGVIIGGILTSINNWIQMRHQGKEARKERRIRAREGYLIPLRQVLSKYMNMSVRGYTAYTIFKEMQEKGEEREYQMDSFKKMMDFVKGASEAMNEIEIISGQTSDANLTKMVLDIKNQQPEVELIVRRYSKWFVNIKDIDPNDWKALQQQYNSIVSNQLNRLMPINKRIEELLCGEEDT